MSLFSSPAPQWQDVGGIIAASLLLFAMYVDADGDLAVDEAVTPTRYLSTDVDGDLSADVTPPGTLSVVSVLASDLIAY